MVVETPNPAKAAGHISRVAITNSREDLTCAQALAPEVSSPKNLDSSYRKKSVTKINIGAGFGMAPDAISVGHFHSKSDAYDEKSMPPPNNVTKAATSPQSIVTSERKTSQATASDAPIVDNNNVLSTKSKNRTLSSSSDHSKLESSMSMHSLVDKRSSNSSSTTTATTASANVSKASSVTMSGSYHHLHHLSEVKSPLPFNMFVMLLPIALSG